MECPEYNVCKEEVDDCLSDTFCVRVLCIVFLFCDVLAWNSKIMLAHYVLERRICGSDLAWSDLLSERPADLRDPTPYCRSRAASSYQRSCFRRWA